MRAEFSAWDGLMAGIEAWRETAEPARRVPGLEVGLELVRKDGGQAVQQE